MKKICFLVGNLNHSGGAERVTSLIANSLSKHYDICVLSLVNGETPTFEINKNIQLFSLNPDTADSYSFKKNFISTAYKIRQFVKTHNIETIIVVDTISCLFTIPALYGLSINHICWEHFNFINNNGSKLRDIARKMAAIFCDYVVVLTKRDKELWEENLAMIKSNIITINNPSSFEITSHTPQKSFKTVLAVGRLRHVKGFDLLLYAWAKVCESNSEWKLKIVGSGDCLNELQALAKSLNIYDRVEFIPQTKDIETFYKTSSIYCLSSRHEGFPMVLLEAQSFGLPVVAFNCDTGPSEIIQHGYNGFLSKASDIHALATDLSKCIDSTEEEFKTMASNSLKAAKQYNCEVLSKQWLKII